MRGFVRLIWPQSVYLLSGDLYTHQRSNEVGCTGRLPVPAQTSANTFTVDPLMFFDNSKMTGRAI